MPRRALKFAPDVRPEKGTDEYRPDADDGEVEIDWKLNASCLRLNRRSF